MTNIFILAKVLTFSQIYDTLLYIIYYILYIIYYILIIYIYYYYIII
jgi:hypothetical protein